MKTLRAIWLWYHKPGVRPIHFHVIRAALCIAIAALAWHLFKIGHEVASGMVTLKICEVIAEIACDFEFPIHV